MKAWQVNGWCEPEGMHFTDVALPQPGPHQVRIRTHAAALNFFDLLQIQGKYQVKPPFPFTPGAEAAGVVDAIGSQVTTLAAGERVMAMTMGGAYAEFTLADSCRTFKIPDGMSWQQAAAMPVVYHTSWFALHRRGALRPGETLLVHAGASGVGMSAIQIGKALGATVIATAGDPDKLQFSRAQGADHALSYSEPSWVDRVKEITNGRGADVIYDPVGGDVLDLSMKCIAPEGRLLVIGFASGRIPAIQANRILLKNISVCGVFWGGFADVRPEFMQQTQTTLVELYSAGRICPSVTCTYPLSEAPKAMYDLAARRVIGKAVLTVE